MTPTMTQTTTRATTRTRTRATTRALNGREWRPGIALLALFTGWVALFAWSGMVFEPLTFLLPTLLVGVVIVLAGAGLRVLLVSWYVVAAAQVFIALLTLNLLFAGRQSFLALIPTRQSVQQVVYVINNGAATLNHYAAPVDVNPTHTRAILTACGLAVLLSIDILAVGLRRPALIALPLLVTLSVPVSILRDALALPVFIGTALLFLRLMAAENLDRFRRWGAGGRGQEGTAAKPALATLWQVSIVAVVGALLAAPVIPVTNLLDRDIGAGAGDNAGSGSYQLAVVNPFIRLRRDLVQQTHTPLLYAETQAGSTSYLRTTVLDRFTSEEWRPSPRDLPGTNKADGIFPNPPGLAAGVGGTEDDWSFQFAPGFTSTWLPLPYPLRKLDVPGTWRYDSRTLDVAYIGGGAPPELKYSATSFTPAVTAELLNSSINAPAKLRGPMTAVPKNLPNVITTKAREVTRGAEGNFAKAVALQEWFRQGGGFRYSLGQRSGSGMDLLASFVTDDRVGYCEQFAAAMAAMGRALDIPSRVVVGFLDGTAQPDGRILYTSDDRHAWPEMYFSGVGWVRFEPTPGQRAGATPPWTRQDVNTADPSAAPSAAASQGAAAKPDQAPVDSLSGDTRRLPIPSWSILSLLVLVGLGLVPALVRGTQRRRRLAGSDPVHLAEGAWAELRATAIDMGLDWPEQRSPREQARSVVDQVHAEAGDVRSLEGLLVRVEQGRYAREGGIGTVDPEVRSRTVETVDAWRRAMVGSVDRERGWRGRVWPVSLVRGRRK
jgi:transglutaminase-like putative cysteine protease